MIIEHEDIRSYIENLIKTKLLSYAQSNDYEDLRDKTVVANETYDGKEKKDIKVILKYLSAQNLNGVVDLPIQILVDVNSDLQDIVFNILQDIAYSKNQTLDYIKDETLSTQQNIVKKYSFKQFYNTPIVLGTFQNSGITKTTTMTMDARLVVFQTIATANDIYLNLTIPKSTTTEGVTTWEDYEYTDGSTAMATFKNSLINAVFHIEHRFDGVVKKAKKLQENKHNSYNISFTISYILDSSSTIQMWLQKNSTECRSHTIAYKSQSSFDTKTFGCFIQTYTENVLVSDVTKVTITFISNGA